MRAIAVAVLFALSPHLVTAQKTSGATAMSNTEPEKPGRLSLHAAAGPTVIGGGNVVSASVGYSPASPLELLLNVERTHLPFTVRRFPDGYSATRGGTMTFVSAEVRVALPADRVSPYAMIGAGRGVSRPTVNDHFPNPVENDARVFYLGGGIQVPLRGGFSLLGDARAMLAVAGYDTVMGLWPVRVGVAWRF